MPPEESVTHWIEQLQAGDQTAAQPLWERYFQRLVRLARRRLQGMRRAAADEEDVALSAFNSFCRAAEEQRFPQLVDRHDLWRLLLVITERKAIHLLRAQGRVKRGGGRVVGESGLRSASAADVPDGLDALPSPEPTPAFAALMAEECERLLASLGDDTLRRVVLLKLEGYGNEEIAGQLGCALRTVERKLGLVRKLWEREVSP